MAQLGYDIQRIFGDIWRQEKQSEPPELKPDTILLDTGLDSLGFAIFVSALEEDLGYDPFTLAEDAFYPQTFAEFVTFYEKYRPTA